jgi:hypothetical protein
VAVIEDARRAAARSVSAVMTATYWLIGRRIIEQEQAVEAPCDPKTLTRAARDLAEEQPAFAVSAGVLALHWLVQGYGYEISGADVWAAYSSTMKAAERNGQVDEVRERVRALVASERAGGFVAKILGRELGL